jgi:hypothetical protein
MGNASKPISLYPMKFKDAVSALLKVKPEPRRPKSKKRVKSAPQAKAVRKMD